MAFSPTALDSCPEDFTFAISMRVCLTRRCRLLLHQAQYGQTALMHASRVGNIECVRLLLDAGADANFRNSVRVTDNCKRCVDSFFQYNVCSLGVKFSFFGFL